MTWILVGAAVAGTSELWGVSGELWEPTGRLPDFSSAGYRAGQEPPSEPVSASVLDFGAIPDDGQDDSAAFQAAIDATTGVLEIPAGTYVIDAVLHINHSDLVLRGAGPEQTTLSFPSALTDLEGAAAQWSWNGGLIWIAPPETGSALTTVEPALRGDTRLSVGDTTGLQDGQLVELRLDDDEDRSLGWHLHNDQEAPGDCDYQVPLSMDWPVRIARVIDAQTVELQQPLRLDIRAEWSPQLYSLPALSEIGVEGLTLAFPPDQEYPGHLDERGYNGIFLDGGVVDAWFQDLVFRDADNGLLVDQRSKHITARRLRFEGRMGHHGFNVAHAHDGLFADVHYAADYFHSVTVDHRASGNVFMRFSAEPGLELELDHHRDSPFENLWTAFSAPHNLVNGGNFCAGSPGGARNTVWGMAGPTIPPYWDHVQTNVIGPIDEDTLSLTADQEWLEPVDDLRPRNLYLAQRAFQAGEPYADTGLQDTGTPAAPDPQGCGGCGGTAPLPGVLALLLGLVALRRATPAD